MSRFLAPAHLPDYPALLEAVGNPAPRDVAALLGVSAATERAYRAHGAAPRPQCLALYWEGAYGRDLMACDTVNEARRLYGLCEAFAQENARLRGLLQRLESLADFGCANSPARNTFSNPLPWPLPPCSVRAVFGRSATQLPRPTIAHG